MVERFEVELRNLTPLSYFDIVVFIFSERHAVVDDVRKVHENILNLLPFLTDSCFEAFDPLWDDLRFFHQCCGILFLLSRLRDSSGNLVPSLPQLISIGLKAPPVSIELQEEIHLANLVRQVPLPQALPDHLGGLPHELDVEQDVFAPWILVVGKKTMSPLVVPRLFKDQALQTPVLELHQHDVVYFGVVNLIDNGYVMGAIDVWKCRSCPQTFCEDKRYGMTDLAPEVGLPKIEPGSKWAALICTRNTGSNWTLIQTRPGAKVQHSCTPDTKLELTVGPDYSIEVGPASGIGQHRIILVENFVNAPVDVITGKKHLGTTNANQALGKPFSFTPPLSAAVISPSRYNVLNLTSILFIISGIWLGLVASFSLATPATFSIFAILALATVVSGVFLRKPKLWPATLGLAAVAIAFVAQLLVQFGGGLTASATALDILLAASVITGWLSWSRVRSLRAKQWHPLDMPAYG